MSPPPSKDWWLAAALTGAATSPPIFEVMEVLGREESLARLTDIMTMN